MASVISSLRLLDKGLIDTGANATVETRILLLAERLGFKLENEEHKLEVEAQQLYGEIELLMELLGGVDLPSWST